MPTHYPDGTPIGTPTRGQVPSRPPARPTATRPASPATPTPPPPPPALLAALHGQVDLAAYAMAAAAAKPWRDGDPITWAVATGRITVEGAEKWRTYVHADPDVGLPVLAALEPVLDPRLTAMAAALTTSSADEDEVAEFDHLQPPAWRVRQPEEEDVSEFDHLHPPHQRQRQPQDTLDAELAEFDGLFPPHKRYGGERFGLTDDDYQARLGGH
ncbi:hypothetical protein AB0873_09530 [Micromonospora sp. NPDC047707]|uniref:hypothetical protein n=1 Tax=Micromonospora sp. NPDC047707 TaxID=3154498 RepID=UPI0034545FB6